MKIPLLILLPCVCFGSDKIHTLYNSLDPLSIPQHLAFHELYPDTVEGRQALKDAWKLLLGKEYTGNQTPPVASNISGVISLIIKQPGQEPPLLTDSQLNLINDLASDLPNRRLAGFKATSEEEVLTLDPEQIDLGRAVFLAQFSDEEKLKNYEAVLDLMALQIRARLSPSSTPKDKIRAMNDFIFDEMGYRFPPHSLYAKDVDLYTFLPSVLDSRRGVCLGVSVLYICLAQRLGLNLEMITPPGHIYVRYRDGNSIINIETTARGIDTDSEVYLGIETRSLQQRSLKEVIGLTYFNQASVYWHENNYEKGLECFLKAKKYLPHDKLLKELMGYNYIILGEMEKGIPLLKEIANYLPDHAVTRSTLPEDFLAEKVNAEGIRAVFMHVDENRESVLKKKEALEKVLKEYPDFREGWICLATTWLQLHRNREALELLTKYHTLYSNNPTAEYYQAALHAERFDLNSAWEHLRNAEALTEARNHHPKILKEFRKQLARLSPE